ncbi:MAG: hypothetical protein KC468_33570 [Myxococcales bacterium]|nr:hypothetical protein [Myxococcales bacterium]
MNALVRRFFRRLPVRAVENDEALHLLSEEETRVIRARHRVAVSLAASIAVLGAMSYYLPAYWWPALFPSVSMRFPWVGRLDVPWAQLLWGLVVMAIELQCLVLINVWAVHEIAVATGLLGEANKHERMESLLQVALNEKARGLLRYGIDPLLGINRWLMLVYTLLLRLKGFLGKKFLQYVVRQLLGRLAIRQVLDFIGMPLYMLINAYATHAIIREAKVNIIGQQLIAHVDERLPPAAVVDSWPDGQGLIYDTLQLVAASKRDFHFNHYILAKAVIEGYELAITPRTELPADYVPRLRAAPEQLRRLCVLLLILGFILDGQFTRPERRRLRELQEAGISEVTIAEVERWCQALVSGEGLDVLLDGHLDPSTTSPAGDAARGVTPGA